MGLVVLPLYLLRHSKTIRWHELIEEIVVLFPLFFCPSKEAELITKFLPMLMSFVVDDHTFNVDQKLPSEEKGPIPYPSTIPEAFTKYVPCLPDFVHVVLLPKLNIREPAKNTVCGKVKAFLRQDLVSVNQALTFPLAEEVCTIIPLIKFICIK